MLKHSHEISPIISEKDLNLIVVKCNKTFLYYAGVNTADKIIGHTDYDFPWSEYAQIYQAHELDALNGKNYSALIPFKNYKGENSLFLHTKIQKTNSKNKAIGISCLAIKIINPELNKLCDQLNKQIKSHNFTIGKPCEFKFSTRQKEILFYLSRGKRTKEIAKCLNLSVRTIEHYIEAIKIKTGCNYQNELIELCFKYNLSDDLPLSMFT